ncbi:MAG: DUF4402 domain-containing protein [Phenylobacterium sp.]|nr:DUF4402 domain-containing protein [Phenylobacterium sp.]
MLVRRVQTWRSRGLLLAGGVALLAAQPAAAAIYTVNIENPLDIGTVAAGSSGDTVFRIDSGSGAVTVLSGAGRRVTGGSVRASVTVTCRHTRAGETTCDTANVPIRVAILGPVTGRARSFGAFNVTMGTATMVGGASGGQPLDFQIAPPGHNTPKTFVVGADFPVAGDDSGLPTGLGENTFSVAALDGSGFSMGGDADRGRVRTLRALSINATSDLNFGRIQIPASGSSKITLNAGTGVRTVTGGAFAYPTPAPTRAAFTISGEGNQQVSLTIPSSVVLTGPGSLTLNLTDNAPATPRLSGALGAPGTYSFNVGGVITIAPTTPIGAYSGVISVSVDYN